MCMIIRAENQNRMKESGSNMTNLTGGLPIFTRITTANDHT